MFINVQYFPVLVKYVKVNADVTLVLSRHKNFSRESKRKRCKICSSVLFFFVCVLFSLMTAIDSP